MTEDLLILENQHAAGHHVGVDGSQKVRYLMNGVKCVELGPVTTSIMANPALQDDFERCVILYRDFIKQTMTTEIRTYGVSQLGTNGGGGGGGGTHMDLTYDEYKDTAVEDVFYVQADYKKLPSHVTFSHINQICSRQPFITLWQRKK